MAELTEVERLLVVVAHYDDEALFCGGTLLARAGHGGSLHVAVVTAVEETNAPEGPPWPSAAEERGRQRRRLAAFDAVCSRLGASAIHLRQKNSRSDGSDTREAREAVARGAARALGPLVAELEPDAVLTHGAAGEYGHPQHALTHGVVRSLWAGPAWTFAAAGGVTYPVDWPGKRELLELYRHGTTQKPIWDPTCKPAYAPWCGETESFDVRPAHPL